MRGVLRPEQVCCQRRDHPVRGLLLLLLSLAYLEGELFAFGVSSAATRERGKGGNWRLNPSAVTKPLLAAACRDAWRGQLCFPPYLSDADRRIQQPLGTYDDALLFVADP